MVKEKTPKGSIIYNMTSTINNVDHQCRLGRLITIISSLHFDTVARGAFREGGQCNGHVTCRKTTPYSRCYDCIIINRVCMIPSLCLSIKQQQIM